MSVTRCNSERARHTEPEFPWTRPQHNLVFSIETLQLLGNFNGLVGRVVINDDDFILEFAAQRIQLFQRNVLEAPKETLTPCPET